jgi:uncharacterized membrane protein
MPSAFPKWILFPLVLLYLVAANFAFTRGSPAIAAVAVAMLFAFLLGAMRGHMLLRIALGILGLAFVVSVALAWLPPLPILLPPIIIPLGLVWAFGHTLLPGRVPLVERFARALHAPMDLEPGMVPYTRRVTWIWTLLLAAICLGNIALVANLSPGGLLELLGLRPWWPVAVSTFVWASNTASYLLIGLMFVVEFAVRVHRFPGYRFRNPISFFRQARARMPAMIASMRGD